MPVGFMCFRGWTLHISEITTLLQASPATTVILDHLGFVKAAAPDKEWESLLNMARFPQVYIKISALFRTSGAPHPHNDLAKRLSAIVMRFGASRLLWGSDFPYAVSQYGSYSKSLQLPNFKLSDTDRVG